MCLLDLGTHPSVLLIFLFLAGLRVKYNLNKPVNQRVVEVKVLCSDCEIPKYEPLEENKMYDVILSNFILLGGDGYTVVKDHAQQKHIVGKSRGWISYFDEVPSRITAMHIISRREQPPCS